MGTLAPRAQYTRPDVWNWFSHSYGDGNAGSFDQTGRMDAIFRQMLDIEYTNWRKYAVAGSRLVVEGAAAGGWATLWRETSGGKFPAKTFPYTGEGGALAMVFGINDLGTLGGATTQIRSGYQQALRSCISRWRASTIFETTASNTAFGGTWTTETTKPDQASSSEWRWTNTVNSTVTITLPSDYDGSPVAICFRGSPGTGSGATATFSGTAGVTGTIVTENVMPSGTLTGVPVIKRITNLTSSNAGQTIIVTATTINGLLHYDCWWIESKSPPPVIVADCPRLTATGYSTKYPSWTQQTGSLDSDVTTLNADMASVIAEFDGMVQMAYLDAKLNKDATLFSDGLHPNDRGAALCADALMEAVNRLTPNRTYGVASQMNVPAQKSGVVRLPHRGGSQYHSPEYQGTPGTVTGTAGTMFAMPFPITEARTTWDTWAIEVSGAATTAGYQVRVGIFNDLNFTGYPDTNLQELTASGVLNTSTTAGVKTTNGGGYIWRPDPGLYWLVLKVEVVGTGGTPTLRTIAGPSSYMPNATSSGSVASANFVAWQLTGQSTGVFPTTFPAGATLVTSCPVVTVRRV